MLYCNPNVYIIPIRKIIGWGLSSERPILSNGISWQHWFYTFFPFILKVIFCCILKAICTLLNVSTKSQCNQVTFPAVSVVRSQTMSAGELVQQTFILPTLHNKIAQCFEPNPRACLSFREQEIYVCAHCRHIRK